MIPKKSFDNPYVHVPAPIKEMNKKNGVTNKLIIPRSESIDNIGFASTADISPFAPIRHKVISKAIPLASNNLAI